MGIGVTSQKPQTQNMILMKECVNGVAMYHLPGEDLQTFETMSKSACMLE